MGSDEFLQIPIAPAASGFQPSGVSRIRIPQPGFLEIERISNRESAEKVPIS
jgi:hypothetical protein